MKLYEEEDPHGIIPSGLKTNNYEVVGFVNTSGKSVLSLMVCVKYPGYVENGWGYSTTLDYIQILKEYMNQVDMETLYKVQRNWRKKQIEQFEKDNTDDEDN